MYEKFYILQIQFDLIWMPMYFKNEHSRHTVINKPIAVSIYRNVLQNWTWDSLSPSVLTAPMSTWSWDTFSRRSMQFSMELNWSRLEAVGLTPLHNAMKAGFTMWQLDKLLRALHFLFHNVPARRRTSLPWLVPPAFRYYSAATDGLKISLWQRGQFKFGQWLWRYYVCLLFTYSSIFDSATFLIMYYFLCTCFVKLLCSKYIWIFSRIVSVREVREEYLQFS